MSGRILGCPCGSAAVAVILPGRVDGRHPVHGLMPWPIPTRRFCSVSCCAAATAGWPHLVTEAPTPRRAAVPAVPHDEVSA